MIIIVLQFLNLECAPSLWILLKVLLIQYKISANEYNREAKARREKWKFYERIKNLNDHHQTRWRRRRKKKVFLLNLMAPRARTAIKENNDFTVMPISFISSFFNWNSIKNRFQLIPSEDIPTQTTLRFIYFRRKSIEISSQFRRESDFLPHNAHFIKHNAISFGK